MHECMACTSKKRIVYGATHDVVEENILLSRQELVPSPRETNLFETGALAKPDGVSSI